MWRRFLKSQRDSLELKRAGESMQSSVMKRHQGFSRYCLAIFWRRMILLIREVLKGCIKRSGACLLKNCVESSVPLQNTPAGKM